MASKAAGGCLLVLLGGGAATVLVIAAPTVGILTLWGVGFGVLWWSVSHARNPSPDRGPETPVEEEPQVDEVTVTKVGEACTVVSHPSERRSYRVERSGAADSGGT